LKDGKAPEVVWTRLVRKGPVVELYYSLDGKEYIQYRYALFTTEKDVQVGVNAACPKGKGFTVGYRAITLNEAK
jgi:regulation of enolase protein 1 (concanavalin A-like superfamily)